MARRFLARALCALAVGGSAPAMAFFSDSFDANVPNLDAVPTGWTVSNGTVDIVGFDGINSFYDYQPGNGLYIDLDGSTFASGLLSRGFALAGGLTYTASFALAGRPDEAAPNTVAVYFGASSDSYVRTQNDGFTTFSLQFTPATSGNYTLSFQNSGGDNFGALLDNVAVTAVPEPATLGLMLAGLAVLGGLRRHRVLARSAPSYGE